MGRIVCIAGKYSMPVKGLDYILKEHGDETVWFLPHESDEGIDGWLPSFRRFAESKGVRRTSLEEVYPISDLIFVSLNYPDILKPSKFKTNKLFNVHPSLLPKYRGMFTSTTALLYGETRSGSTLHRLDSGIDTGDIIDQSTFDITINDTARDLYYKHQAHCAIVFERNISSILDDSFIATPQPAIGTSYFSKNAIDFSTLTTNLNKTAFQIHNQFRSCIFREFQLPTFRGWQISRTEITHEKSRAKAGSVVAEEDSYFIINSTDFNVRLHKDYYTLFWQAAEFNDEQKLDTCLPFIQDIDLRDKEGLNALMRAAQHGSLSCAARLMKQGADPSSANYMGKTVLMHAADYYVRTKDRRPFELILGHGADHRLKDKNGKSIRDYLRERSASALQSSLLQ